jgi:TRAP-type uncharacterized transport system substrate-binding protein
MIRVADGGMISRRGEGGRALVRTLAIAAAVAAVVATVAAVLLIMGPAPPRSIAMATGPEGSAYHQFGERYRELLARHRVELRLVPSSGSVDNLQRLSDAKSEVSVAFLQGGIASAANSPELVSLGTLFYEPVWLFARELPRRASANMFKGKRMSIGPEGSGTRRLALELIDAIGLDSTGIRLVGLSSQDAAEAMLRGEIEVAVMVAPWESPAVRRLLASEVNAISFPRADAHVALRPYLSKLVVPQGVADLARNRPPGDLVVVAPKASLVVRKDLHPAIQYLLLDAASQIHSAPGIFQRAGQFPAAEPIELPLSEDARQYYQSGRPFLQRYLPFWLAVFAGRLLVILIPVVGVLFPLMRLVPAVYGWAMRHRIFGLYGELKFLEAEMESRAAGENVDDLVARLNGIEQRASHLKVSTMFAHLLYTVRIHIGLVRQRLLQHRK